MIFIRLLAVLTLFMFIGTPTLLQAGKKKAGPGKEDVVIRAMTDEMNRAVKSLKLENLQKPYYFEYTMLDIQQVTLECSFGSVNRKGGDKQRIFKVDVRVGDYQLDNSEFIGRRGMYGAIMGGTRNMVIDDDYDALRHDIWLATDAAYKAAAEQYAEKEAYVKNQVQSTPLPDFSKEKPLRLITPKIKLKFDHTMWRKTLKKLSAIFKAFPLLHESYVELQSTVIHRYYVNSEGTVLREPFGRVTLEALAITQASDGMTLKHYLPFYATSLEHLPPEKELSSRIKQMAQQLSALCTAPVLDSYIGPVLFKGQASAELFVQLLLPHLSGQSPPLSNMPQITQMAPASKLIRRLNRKVLPRSISILDDPTMTQFGTTPMIGSYAVDDQGVAAVPVKLVENGILKNLLMSRRPGKTFQHSNGHARASMMGKTGVQISNLLVTTKKGKSHQQLKEKLIAMCNEQQVPFGLIVETLDNPAITGLDPTTSARMMQNPQNPPLTAPIIVYRVFANGGRQELVRGISITELGVNDLKYISDVGRESYVHHRLVAPAGGIMNSVYTIFSSGNGNGMRLPVSIAAPPLLFEEVEFEKINGERDKPPFMPHPYFSRNNTTGNIKQN